MTNTDVLALINHFTTNLGYWKICVEYILTKHYNDVIMGAIASQITSHTIVFSAVYLDTDQRKHESSASLAFARGIHRRPVNSPHKWPVTRKMFPFDDVIMSASPLDRDEVKWIWCSPIWKIIYFLWVYQYISESIYPVLPGTPRSVDCDLLKFVCGTEMSKRQNSWSISAI